MAFFVRGISGPDYRHQAVRAGLELLSAVGYGMDSGPWLDVGAAVNAGPAYVGNVGGAVVDFTALGDTVNAAARMQQAAAGGVARRGRSRRRSRGAWVATAAGATRPRPADRRLRVDHLETWEEARFRRRPGCASHVRRYVGGTDDGARAAAVATCSARSLIRDDLPGVSEFCRS
jgi:class 3 adenylate cyclase